MACNFTIKFPGSASSVLEHAKQQIQNYGGTFTGSNDSGAFEISVPAMGSISGTYAITGQQVTIDITHKPFIISCSQIQHYLETQVQ